MDTANFCPYILGFQKNLFNKFIINLGAASTPDDIKRANIIFLKVGLLTFIHSKFQSCLYSNENGAEMAREISNQYLGSFLTIFAKDCAHLDANDAHLIRLIYEFFYFFAKFEDNDYFVLMLEYVITVFIFVLLLKMIRLFTN